MGWGTGRNRIVVIMLLVLFIPACPGYSQRVYSQSFGTRGFLSSSQKWWPPHSCHLTQQGEAPGWCNQLSITLGFHLGCDPGTEPHVRLHTQCRVNFRFSLPLLLPFPFLCTPAPPPPKINFKKSYKRIWLKTKRSSKLSHEVKLLCRNLRSWSLLSTMIAHLSRLCLRFFLVCH